MTDTSIPLKQCSRKEKCVNSLGCLLPATDEYFYRDSRVKSGLCAKCKACQTAANILYQRQHPEGSKLRTQRYRAKYPEKNRDRQRAYRRDHVEQCREYNRGYRRRHPDRDLASVHKRRGFKRGNGGTYTPDDIRAQVLMQTNSRGELHCWWCDCVIMNDVYHIDHRIPLSRGGANSPENLCIACPTCNLRKQDKLPQEWIGRLL